MNQLPIENIQLNKFVEDLSLVERETSMQCIQELLTQPNSEVIFYQETLHVPDNCRFKDFNGADLCEILADFDYKVDVGGLMYDNVRIIPCASIIYHDKTIVFNVCDIGKTFVLKKMFLQNSKRTQLINGKVFCDSNLATCYGLGGCLWQS